MTSERPLMRRMEPCVAVEAMARIAPARLAAAVSAGLSSGAAAACAWRGTPPSNAVRSIAEEALPPSQKLEAPGTWAVWRDSGRVLHRRLEADEADLLEAAAQGADFGSLCEILSGLCAEDAVALRAASLLKRWVEAGWVQRAEVPTSPQE